jgi:NAD+ diphosphatase
MFSESPPESTANSPSESTSGQKRSNSKNKLSIAKLSTKHVQALLGPKPYFGQSQNAGSLVTIPKDEKHSPLEAARHLGPTVIFLGLDEHLQQQQLDRSSVYSTATATQTTGTDTGSANGALPSSDFSDPDKAVANLQGTAYFALDVSSPGCDEFIVQQVIRDAQNDLSNTQGQGHGQLIWAESRAVIVSSDPFEAALFAVGRSLTDWNLRNQVRVYIITPCVSYELT